MKMGVGRNNWLQRDHSPNGREVPDAPMAPLRIETGPPIVEVDLKVVYAISLFSL
jgi:hypothetical protein